HLAYHENIWRLSQGRAQRSGKIRRVRADLDLLDNASNVRVLVLDGVFDCDDVARLAAIDVVDESGEGCRFTGTSRTPDEDEAARQMRERFDRRRKVELAKRGNLLRQGANRGCGAS